MNRLGRLPHDPARLAALAPHRLAAAAPPPPRLIRTHLPLVPMLGGNDWAPDCTTVAVANAARARAAMQGYDTPVGDTAPLAFYARTAGIPDTRAAIAASDGAVLLDVIEAAAAHGYDVGQQAPLVPTGITRCDTRAEVAAAMAARGAAIMGVQLMVGDQSAGVWSTDYAAGATWGGHAVMAWDYTGLADNDLVRIGTWGDWKPATWAWIEARAEEAYSVTWPQLDAAGD